MLSATCSACYLEGSKLYVKLSVGHGAEHADRPVCYLQAVVRV